MELSATLGVGVVFDKNDKLWYSVRGKKSFPVTNDGLLSFNIMESDQQRNCGINNVIESYD